MKGSASLDIPCRHHRWAVIGEDVVVAALGPHGRLNLKARCL